ncbi:PIN domain nuclease [Nocardioides caeni]|uniref:Ribonuclease VapC n=1 Tax=Nocardioides caeni TaxID=574700 RepID=A0A4S8NGZ7_9ACTN|nr:PIN domain nuclease [Nocardioides caeni]THV16047.1 PIN domain nuclease [Nocardioides caeni]
MILVDSSAWVEFDRASGSAVDVSLAGLIAEEAPLVVTEPVVMEVCAGAKSPRRERDLRRLLGRFGLARFDPAADFNGALTLYRTCRSCGVTPRGLIDCMIAAVALRHDAEVLSHDRDFARMAEATGLRLHVDSLR